MKTSESNVRKNLEQFQHSAWKTRVKQAFSKGISKLIDIDPVLGPDVLEQWKVWRISETDIRGSFNKYKTVDEYIEERILEIGYP